MKGLRQAAIVSVMAAVFIAAPSESLALPSFAREFGTSCATCHEAFPRLNATGEAFRLDGMQFPEGDFYREHDPTVMADEAYRFLWPDALWPSDIPGLPPLSLQVTSDFNVNFDGTTQAEFSLPRDVKLFAAGAMGESISGFAELVFSRAGAPGHGHNDGDGNGDDVRVKAWLRFQDLVGPENSVNLRVGTVGMHELGLFTARDHNRLSISSYMYTQTALPSADEHALEHETGWDNVEFEGNPFSIHDGPGVELGGYGQRWRYALGVLTENREAFSSSFSDTYLQLAYKIGGFGFDGSGIDEPPAEPWRDDSLTLSLFGFHGRQSIKLDHADIHHSTKSDDFMRLGAGALWRRADLQLGGGYMYGRHRRPFGPLDSTSVSSDSFFGEVNYFVYPWLIPYARYERLIYDWPDDDLIREGFGDDPDRSRAIVGAKMLIRANVSLNFEGRYNSFGDRSGFGDLLFSLSAAF